MSTTLNSNEQALNSPQTPSAINCIESVTKKILAQHTLQLDDVVKFCFPSNSRYPDSSSRLFALAEYGPLFKEHSHLSCLCVCCQHQLAALQRAGNKRALSIRNGEHITPLHLEQMSFFCTTCRDHISTIVHLKAGYKGKHIVSDSELNKLCSMLHNEDIVSVFNMGHGFLTPNEEIKFIRQLHPRLQTPFSISKHDIRVLFKPITRASCANDASLDFHEASALIRRHRHKRLLALRDHDFATKQIKKQHRVKISRRSAMMPASDSSQSTSSSYELVSRLLHKHAFKVTNLDTRQRSDVVENVKVLLNRVHDAQTRWEPNF